MNPSDVANERRIAVIVGALFIIATAFLFLGEAFYRRFLDAADVLEIAAQNKPTIMLGLSIELVCILAMPLIGAFIYPILARVSVAAAGSYLFFRSLEAVILVSVALSNKLAILSLSEAYAAGAERASLEPALALARAQNIWAATDGALYNIVFVCGALCLYAVLFRSRLTPRWISLWGLLSAGLLGALAASAVFVAPPAAWEVALIAPLAVQEMVMALWFIFRGFDTRRLERPDRKTPTDAT